MDQRKGNGFTGKKLTISADTMTDTDYVDDLTLLRNKPRKPATQPEAGSKRH